MTEILKEALKNDKSWGTYELLTLLKRTYMSKRQVGLSEAIYRASPSLHLQEANIACTFVQSGYPKNQSKFLKRVYKKNEKDDDGHDDSDESGSEIEEVPSRDPEVKYYYKKI